jgi:hypothetical protein
LTLANAGKQVGSLNLCSLLGGAAEIKLRGGEVFDCDSGGLENCRLANWSRFGPRKNFTRLGEDFGLGEDHIP